MTGGINDTKTIKLTVGANIRNARKQKKLTMQRLSDILSASKKAPVLRGRVDTISIDRLKMWENGTNPVELEWLPALCEVLECDIGYLFGEYGELTRQASDVCKETGLSENAVEVLQALNGRSKSSLLVENIINTLDLLLENTDERKLAHEVIPLLEYISAYLNCATSDGRIISVEKDGSVLLYDNRETFEQAPGEVIVGDYLRQIIKTRMEQRVLDELKAMWRKKNGEHRL